MAQRDKRAPRSALEMLINAGLIVGLLAVLIPTWLGQG